MLPQPRAKLAGCLRQCAARLDFFASFMTTAHLDSLRDFCLDLDKRNLITNTHPGGLVSEGFASTTALPDVLYAGFDASAESLHVGNLLIINSLLRAVLHKCRAIALIGQATAIAGDPSGRATARQLKDRHSIASNALQISSQIKRITDNFCDIYGREYCNFITTVNNSEWYNKMSLEEYLEVGHKFRVGEMHRLNAVKLRMRNGVGIDYSEFSYQNLQSIDWHQLAQKYNCYFQIGGSDQLGNIDAGYDYIRRASGKTSAGVCLSLITDGEGEKIGKSSTNPNASIWLDESKTSPYAFFQFWRQLPDREAAPLLRYFSLKPVDTVDAIMREHEANLGKWIAQENLAVEMTQLVHGNAGLQLAQRCTKALFHGSLEDLAELPHSVIRSLFGEASTCHISPSEVKTIGDLADRLRSEGVQGSVLMKKGALKLNGVRYLNPCEPIDHSRLFFGGKRLTVVCWGKRHYSLVVWIA